MSYKQPEQHPEVFAGIPVGPGEPFNPYAIAEIRLANEQALSTLQQIQLDDARSFVERALLSASLLRNPITDGETHNPQVVSVGDRNWGKWSFDITYHAGQYDGGVARYTQSLAFDANGETTDLRVYRMKAEDLSDGRTLGRLRVRFNEFNQIETIQLRWRVTKDHMAAYELMGLGSVPVGNENLRAFLDLFGNQAIAADLRNNEMSWNTLTIQLGANPSVFLDQRFFSAVGFDKTLGDINTTPYVHLQSDFIYDEAHQQFVRHFGFGQERRHRKWADDRFHKLQKTMTTEQFMQGVHGLLALVPQES